MSPRGDRIIFTSTRGGDLDLYNIRVDGTRLIFASNRNATTQEEPNLFLADWNE